MDDLDRVFQRLVQNIRTRSPEQLTFPFTVAELYEQMIPYRHNRRELGIETNQDYEIAIMRLLSGERDYIVGDEAMQDTLKKEMGSANPDTGAFREFATAQISISPSVLEKRPDRSPDDRAVSDMNVPEGCRYCTGTLPEGRPVTFCPHCGQNLTLNHCPACGAEIEQGWKFCVGCGRPNS